ncbi:metallophosphoesterase [Aquimarina latercula]|uniref:metallophosphoesterase n=1 Tax=Aquimarina latercula TaxID=987 RepID=UPI00040F67F7|nr:metallophosphoesterase [Aquimarina latercula]
MDSIILHISDFHVSLDKKLKEERVNSDSFLRASKEGLSLQYIDKFIQKVKQEFSSKNIYLLVTGDITDCGAELEFNYAKTYLENIITELKIKKECVLLIPGDHDINRKDIENLIYSKETYNKEEVNVEKFKNFSAFYEAILGKKFDPNKVIFDTLEIENRFLLLGVNSSYYVDIENTEGKIDVEKFKLELKETTKDSELKNVICCHHNITSLYENKNSGQWNTENRLAFTTALESNNIKFIFSGNEHTSGCKKIAGDSITISDSGTLSSKKDDSAFKIYELENNDADNVILVNHIYGLQKVGGNDDPYYWDKRSNTGAKQQEKFEISVAKPPVLEDEVIDLVDLSQKEESPLENSKKQEIEISNSDVDVYYNSEYTEVLYDKVKELNLFHSGHFHWSETSRAHNWIDTSKLIENNEDLSFTKNAIIDVIEKKQLEKKIDLIIGLGYEGNIISSKATIKFNKPYAFLPYSYRHDEHHHYENELNYDNSAKKFKNVLIITDVVNDGRTIRKLLKKRKTLNTFFENVNKVYVISLFYTGESKLNNNILNFDFVKNLPNYDFDNDEEVNNIEFYTVKSLKVEKCPYGADFRETCLIVKDGLGCVNLFYDESKYLE